MHQTCAYCIVILTTAMTTRPSNSNVMLRRRLLAETTYNALSNVPLWLYLLAAVLVHLLGSASIYVWCEGWHWGQAIFYSVSVALAVGFTNVQVSSDAAVLYTCLHCFVGAFMLAAAGALLVRQVVLRDDKMLRTETVRRAGNDSGHSRSNAGFSCRRFLRTKGKRLLVMLAWLALFGVGYAYGLSDHIVHRPGSSRFSLHADALMWTVSSMTGLGSTSPADDSGWGNLLAAGLYVFLAVPLNAAALALLMDVYISHVQRNEARKKLLTNVVPSQRTFLDIAHTAPANDCFGAEPSASRVTWAVYLEYRLRQMVGTEIHSKLIDEIKDSFDALDVRGRGFIELDDIGRAERLKERLSDADLARRVQHLQAMTGHGIRRPRFGAF